MDLIRANCRFTNYKREEGGKNSIIIIIIIIIQAWLGSYSQPFLRILKLFCDVLICSESCYSKSRFSEGINSNQLNIIFRVIYISVSFIIKYTYNLKFTNALNDANSSNSCTRHFHDLKKSWLKNALFTISH